MNFYSNKYILIYNKILKKIHRLIVKLCKVHSLTETELSSKNLKIFIKYIIFENNFRIKTSNQGGYIV